jgi:hypothetical protein
MTNGREEDGTAAWLARAAYLAEKAKRSALPPVLAVDEHLADPGAEKAQRTRRCAFCGASLFGRCRHARHCSARCRAAASDGRRGRGHRGSRPECAPESRGGWPR